MHKYRLRRMTKGGVVSPDPLEVGSLEEVTLA